MYRKEYAVIKRSYVNDNCNPCNVLKIFDSNIAALSFMEEYVVEFIQSKNGAANCKANGKYDFIFDVSKERSSASSAWTNIQIGHCFVTRDVNEFLKYSIREKFKLPGTFYDSWDTKKIFTIEIAAYFYRMPEETKFYVYEKTIDSWEKMIIDMDDSFDSENPIKFAMRSEYNSVVDELADSPKETFIRDEEEKVALV